jgi:hypothetical protein
MIFEIDKETIDFICKHKITFGQYAICLLIQKGDASTLLRLQEEVGHIGDCMIPLGKGKYKNEIEDLEDRGFLENTFVDKQDYFALDNFKVTPMFTKGLHAILKDAPQQFFDIYPTKLVVNGIEYSARTCDFDEMEEKYLKAINHSVTKHKEVIEKMTNFRKHNTYATVNIMKFIGARAWDELELTTKAKVRGY